MPPTRWELTRILHDPGNEIGLEPEAYAEPLEPGDFAGPVVVRNSEGQALMVFRSAQDFEHILGWRKYPRIQG